MLTKGDKSQLNYAFEMMVNDNFSKLMKKYDQVKWSEDKMLIINSTEIHTNNTSIGWK